MLAGGQLALCGGVLVGAAGVGALITYMVDHVHCDRCHHVEDED